MVEWEDLTTEQQTAAGALDRNVSLTAGAGTGKTTALTARVMRVLRAAVEDAVTDPAPDEPPAERLPVAPRNVLTTTFTERAAGELRESIRAAVNEELDGSDGARRECWRAIADDLEAGYIHTLHGFCSRLLREHALEAERVQPGFETLDEDESAALKRRVATRAIEEAGDSEALELLGARYDRSTVRAIVVDLLEERPESLEWAEEWRDADVEAYVEHVWTELHPVDPEFAARTFRGESGAALDRFVELVAESPAVSESDRLWSIVRELVTRLDAHDLAAQPLRAGVDDRTRQACVNELCDVLTGSDGGRYAESSYEGTDSNWPDAGLQSDAEAAMQAVLAWLEPADRLVDTEIAVDRASFPYVQAVATLLADVGERYRREKRRRNLVDYTDQIGFARSFLLEEAAGETRRALREQFEYVVVDEFQDTDPRQWDIVRALTATDPGEFDAENVFVVGDKKQSIYRFRNADVTMFDGVAGELAAANERNAGDRAETTAGRDESAGGRGEQLSENFRTLPNVLAVVNELFEATFRAGEAAPFEAQPQRLSPHRSDPADVGGSVEYLCVPTDGELLDTLYERPPVDPATATSATELEAEALAARLTQVLASDREVYCTGDDDAATGDPSPAVLNRREEPTSGTAAAVETRAIEPADVTVLLRSRTHLKTYERALAAEDVPYTVASGLGFFESPEVEALLNLLRVLVDPRDERALYGVLRSPLFGFTDETLAHLRVEQPESDLWVALGETDQPELGVARGLLERWRSLAGLGDGEREVESWAALLTDIVETTGYLVSVSAGERPRQAVANVEKFREQVRGWDEEGSASVPALLDRVEERLEHADREGEATVPDDSDGVRVMTVHDAKGEEFPMVVVPRVDRGFTDRGAIADGRVEFESTPAGPALGLTGPDPGEPFADADTVARVGIRRRRRREERAEEKRVLYVACTRARDHLLLSGAHDVDPDAEPGTDGLRGLADANPGEARSWRDWLQATLLDDDLLADLTSAESHTATARLGAGRYEVRLPTPGVDWTPDDEAVEVRTEIGDAPAVGTETTFQLSPSSLAALFAGDGQVVNRGGEDVVSLREAESADASFAPESEPDRLPANVFGDIVHKLAELQPPAEQWRSIAEEYVAADDQARLEHLDEERLRTHAARAIEYVESRCSEPAVRSVHHERFVTAEFERGEVGGFVDLLVVTEDAFHVIDYKTSHVTPETVEAKAAHHEPQLTAYAVALGQQDPERDVHTTLFFTEIDEPVSSRHPASELPELETTLEDRIHDRLDGWL